MWYPTNKQCKYLLGLFITFEIVSVLGLVFICYLMAYGKYTPETYLTGAYTVGIIAVSLTILIRIFIDTIETTEDLDKKIKLKRLEVEIEQMKKNEP